MANISRSDANKKIEALIQWCSKHPELDISNYRRSKDVMSREINSNEEYRTLDDEFVQMKKIYEYLLVRYRHGTISDELFRRCKEANVKGIFGYPSSVEEVARKYRISLERANWIIVRYGSLENFVNFYKQRKNEIKDDVIKESLRTLFDLDFNPNPNFDILLSDILKKHGIAKVGMYQSSQLLENIRSLKSKRRDAVLLVYGLGDKPPMNYKEASKEINLSLEGVRQLIKKALDDLGQIAMMKKLIKDPLNQILKWDCDGYSVCDDLTLEEKSFLSELEDIMFSSNYILYPDVDISKEGYDLDKKRLEALMSNIGQIDKIRVTGDLNRESEQLGLPPQVDIILDDDQKGILVQRVNRIGLSVRATNALLGNRIEFVNQLAPYTSEELMCLRGVGKTVCDEVMKKIESLSLYYPELQDARNQYLAVKGKMKDVREMLIKDSSLSVRAKNALNACGLNKMIELLKYDSDYFLGIRNIGEKTLDEILKIREDVRRELEELERGTDKVELELFDFESEDKGENVRLHTIQTIFMIDPNEMAEVITLPALDITHLQMLRRTKRKLTEQEKMFYKKVLEARRLAKPLIERAGEHTTKIDD